MFVPRQLYNTFPALMSLLPGKHQTAFANLSKLKHFFKEEIRKHKEDRNPSSPRDYIDCYLEEIEKVTDFSRCLHNDNAIILRLFLGFSAHLLANNSSISNETHYVINPFFVHGCMPFLIFPLFSV